MSKRFGRNQKRKLHQKMIDQQKEFDRGKWVMQSEVARLQNTILGMNREMSEILRRLNPMAAFSGTAENPRVLRAKAEITYDRRTIERWMDIDALRIDMLSGEHARNGMVIEIAKCLVESMARR